MRSLLPFGNRARFKNEENGLTENTNQKELKFRGEKSNDRIAEISKKKDFAIN